MSSKSVNHTELYDDYRLKSKQLATILSQERVQLVQAIDGEKIVVTKDAHLKTMQNDAVTTSSLLFRSDANLLLQPNLLEEAFTECQELADRWRLVQNQLDELSEDSIEDVDTNEASAEPSSSRPANQAELMPPEEAPAPSPVVSRKAKKAPTKKKKKASPKNEPAADTTTTQAETYVMKDIRNRISKNHRSNNEEPRRIYNTRSRVAELHRKNVESPEPKPKPKRQQTKRKPKGNAPVSLEGEMANVAGPSWHGVISSPVVSSSTPSKAPRRKPKRQ